MDGLTEGRIVHFVIPNGEHRAAIVVLVCPKAWGYPAGTSQLQVFMDGTNDRAPGYDGGGIMWATSVFFSEKPTPGSWHWIERA